MKMFKRILIFIIAIFFCGLGIAISTRAELGTTPISSLPYVLTFMSPLSFGTTTFIVNIIFLIGQILILKKDFKKIQFLQIAVILAFGIFIDIGMHIAGYFRPDFYTGKIIMLIIGSAILALGIFMEVIADIMYVPGEGIVKAIESKTKKDFGQMKTLFDCFLCISAILLSLAVLGTIRGLREGTIFSAILVGTFVSVYNKLWTFINRHTG